MAAKVCLFFIAGTSPTAGETVQIAVLSNYYDTAKTMVATRTVTAT